MNENHQNWKESKRVHLNNFKDQLIDPKVTEDGNKLSLEGRERHSDNDIFSKTKDGLNSI